MECIDPKSLVVFDEDVLSERLLKFLRSETNNRNVYQAMQWYPEAYKTAQEIGRGLVKTNVVSSVIAALSPQIRWEQNVIIARWMVENFLGNRSCPPVSTFRRRKLAWDLLHYEDMTRLTGLKSANFHRNIMGDPHSVTIDSHMSYIFFGYERKYTPRQYGITANSVRNVATYLGLRADIVQAWGWLKIRRERPMRNTAYLWWL